MYTHRRGGHGAADDSLGTTPLVGAGGFLMGTRPQQRLREAPHPRLAPAPMPAPSAPAEVPPVCDTKPMNLSSSPREKGFLPGPPSAPAPPRPARTQHPPRSCNVRAHSSRTPFSSAYARMKFSYISAGRARTAVSLPRRTHTHARTHAPHECTPAAVHRHTHTRRLHCRPESGPQRV